MALEVAWTMIRVAGRVVHGFYHGINSILRTRQGIVLLG